jgi:hypothetical protein
MTLDLVESAGRARASGPSAGGLLVRDMRA